MHKRREERLTSNTMSLPGTKTDNEEQASLLAKRSTTDGRTTFLRAPPPQQQQQLQYGSTTRTTTTPRQPHADDDDHPPKLFSSSLPHVNRVKKRAWSIHSEEEEKGQEETNLGSSAHRESLVRAMREFLGGGTTAADHEVGGGGGCCCSWRGGFRSAQCGKDGQGLSVLHCLCHC